MPTSSMQDALATLAAAPQAAMNEIFKDAHLEGHGLRTARWTREVSGKTAKVKDAAREPAKAVEGRIMAEIRRQVMDQIKQLFDVQFLSDIASIIEQTVLEQAISTIVEVTPYLGMAKNGVYATKSMISVGMRVIAAYRVATCRDLVRPGLGEEAVEALQTLIKREIAFNTSKSSRELVALATKVGGSAADFGTGITHIAVGIGNAVVALIETLTAMALEFRDARAGNTALKESIDATMFGKCPLLACYFLTCASTSDIINFAAGELVTNPNFQKKVEKLRKQIDVVQWEAANAIQTSRFVLVRKGAEVVPSARAVPLLSVKFTTAKSLDQAWLDKGTGHAGVHQPASMKARGGAPAVFGVDSGSSTLSAQQYGVKVAKGAVSQAKTQVARYQHNFRQMVAACLPTPI